MTTRRSGGGSTGELGQIDTEQALEEPVGAFLCPGCRTEQFPQPDSHRVGELNHGSYAPGLPDYEIGAVMAPRLVVTQRGLNRGASAERIGEDERVLERLASTLAEIRVVA